MKYVLVTGGVISGVGKGIISSSLGTIAKNYGLRTTSIKIDPYLNIGAFPGHPIGARSSSAPVPACPPGVSGRVGAENPPQTAFPALSVL